MSERYGEHDRERFVAEPHRDDRPAFQRDRARIVHSSALRRLAAKTQVVGPDSNDFSRNRLTHTLEVAQIGRDLAEWLGCDPDLVEAACLAHDLGHPPFGHNGERALNDAAADIGGFEGNAQTLRLLSRLEAKRMAEDGRSVGLNLTRATLDAATKYPWQRSEASQPIGRHGDGVPRAVRKFGVYEADLEVFDWMRTGALPMRICAEAQLMDLADDIAYSVHDVEDGVASGRIDLSELSDPDLRTAVLDTARDWYDPDLSGDEFAAALERLGHLPRWPDRRNGGSRAELAGLKNLTSSLVNRFCLAVRADALERGELMAMWRYEGTVVVPRETRVEITILKAIAAQLVMKAPGRVELMAAQRALLLELVDALCTHAPGSLEPAFAADFDEAADDASRLRVVVDQVASLTDPSAVEKHRLLVRPPA